MASARKGRDQALFLAGIADGSSSCRKPAADGRAGHKPAVPNRCNQVIAANDAVAISNEMQQEIEDLRLNGNQLGAAFQFAPIRVKRILIKDVPQRRPPRPVPAPQTKAAISQRKINDTSKRQDRQNGKQLAGPDPEKEGDHGPSTPSVSAIRGGWCCAGLRDEHSAISSLSNALSALDRAVSSRWSHRHHCAPPWPVALGALRPAIPHRKPAGRDRQRGHRASSESARRRL